MSKNRYPYFRLSLFGLDAQAFAPRVVLGEARQWLRLYRWCRAMMGGR